MSRPLFVSAIVFATVGLLTGSPHAQAAGSRAPGPAPAPSASAPAPAAAAAVPAVPDTSASDLEAYRIGAEDVLDVAVWNDTAVSRVVPVRPDGKISVPLLGDVQAAGMTPGQLQAVLARELSTYIAKPQVTVIVQQVNSIKVSVLGQVKTPGRFDLKSPATLLDMIAQAGGFTDFAAKDRILVLRTANGAHDRIHFDYNSFVSNPGEQQNFYLQRGDIIIVP
ncbi:MAG TPA: polysaccharide biosynthesis/export family protein [Vicinamibacterales bacterium]|jgi:polysaccharide export outer membrane protein